MKPPAHDLPHSVTDIDWDARAPLDYAEEDEDLPAAARPMFATCERILLASLAAAGALGLWIGWPW